jgi:hypothetical protein
MATPSPISPNVAQDFITGLSSPAIRRTLSGEYADQHAQPRPTPESSVKVERSPTPPIQEATWEEPVALIKEEE